MKCTGYLWGVLATSRLVVFRPLSMRRVDGLRDQGARGSQTGAGRRPRSLLWRERDEVTPASGLRDWSGLIGWDILRRERMMCA